MIIDFSTIGVSFAPGGGDCNIEPRTEYTITKNGSYPINPDDEYDAMEGVDVIVSVPEKQIEASKSATYTANGDYTISPSEGYDGISGASVKVNVPQSKLQATRQVTLNQTESGSTIITPADGYDGMERVSLTVNVPTEEKSATYTANGEYEITKSDDKAGISKATVTVNVPTTNVQDMKIVNQEVKTSGLYVFQPDEGYDAMKVLRANLTIPSTPVEQLILDNSINFGRTVNSDFSQFNFSEVNEWKNKFNSTENCTFTFPANSQAIGDNSGIFYYAKNMTINGIENLDVSQATNLSNIFYGATILSDLDMSGWKFNTALKTNKNVQPSFTSGTFKNVDLSRDVNDTESVCWDSIYLGGGTFAGLTVDNWIVRSTDANIFSGVTAPSINVSTWRFLNEVDFYPFYKSYFTEIIADNMDATKITSLAPGLYVYDQGCFAGTSKTTKISAKNWKLTSCTNMNGAFYQTAATEIDLSGWDTSACTKMRAMFQTCKGLTSLDLSSFNTSNVTTTYQMFEYSSNLNSINLSSFNTSKVTNMAQMFEGCSGLTTLDLSNFTGEELNYTEEMFYGCTGLTSVDLSGLATPNLSSTKSMFYNCKSLTSIDLSNLDMSNVTTSTSMFRNCAALTTVKVVNCNDATKQKILTQLQTDITTKTWTLGDDGIITGS